jgi:hypothetical protein
VAGPPSSQLTAIQGIPRRAVIEMDVGDVGGATQGQAVPPRAFHIADGEVMAAIVDGDLGIHIACYSPRS